MYNRNYYAQVDDAMMKLWKDFGRRLLHVLDGTMRYVLTCRSGHTNTSMTPSPES